MVTPVVYDGSFNGFLTAVFEVYEYKIAAPQLSIQNKNRSSLFGDAHVVATNADKAARVLNKMAEKLTSVDFASFYKVFLSELDDMEKHLFAYVQYVLAAQGTVRDNYANAHVLYVQQTAKKVHREKHRMEAFIRFQLTKDGLHYATIEPDFNVLPLISKHFKNRYADQCWLIYDVKRKYGLYYDMKTVTEVSISFNNNENPNGITAEIFDEAEPFYQTLWQNYFKSVNIAARKNTKLHVQHMPKRYWKYLIEKIPQ